MLVVASSNAAVDNIVLRIHREGIPDGHGDIVRPRMMRLHRHGYDPTHPSVTQYLVNNLARPYDEEERAHPSLTAKRLCADECIVFIGTSSSVGGAQFKELRQDIDIIIHDEAANSLEAETLIPLTSSMHEDGNRRLFYFAIGDERQLPATNFTPDMIEGSKLRLDLPFNMKTLTMSLFEGLVYGNRSTVSFLSAQYRMHPTISRIISPPFYQCLFHCPLPRERFLVGYNQPSLHDTSFYPLTFIDTSGIVNRFETKEPGGQIFNNCEAHIVVDIITRLYNTMPEVNFNEQITVIAPYRAQVEHIERAINNLLPGHQDQNTRDVRDIRVSTIDSMQGNQSDVLIVCTTRSNRQGTVGFLDRSQRLNVAVSRARYLNIIIGDISSLNGRRPVEDLMHIYLSLIHI